MRFIKLLSIAILLFAFSFSTQANVITDCDNEATVSSTDHIPTYTEADIRARLKQMTSAVVPPRFTSVVKGYIDTYTTKRRDKTEKMLGRIQIYFNRDEICTGEDKTKYNDLFKKLLDLGDFIGVEGELFTTQVGEITVAVKDFTLLSKALKPLP